MVHRVHTGYFLGKYGEKYEGREGGRDRFFFCSFLWYFRVYYMPLWCMHVTMHITLCFAVLWSLAKRKSGIPLNFLARVPYKFFSPFFTIIIIIFFPRRTLSKFIVYSKYFPPCSSSPSPRTFDSRERLYYSFKWGNNRAERENQVHLYARWNWWSLHVLCRGEERQKRPESHFSRSGLSY